MTLSKISFRNEILCTCRNYLPGKTFARLRLVRTAAKFVRAYKFSYRYDKLRPETGNGRPKISARAETDFLAGKKIVRARRQCPLRRHIFTIFHAGMTFSAVGEITCHQGDFVCAHKQFQGAASPQLSSRKDNFRYATKFATVSRISLRKENCRNGAVCRSATTFPAGRKTCERSRISGSPSGRLIHNLFGRQNNSPPRQLF